MKASQIAKAAKSWLPDALMVGGACGLSYGAWLAYPPAGWILGGVLSLVAGLILARAG